MTEETAKPEGTLEQPPLDAATIHLVDGQWFKFPLTQGWPAFMTNLLAHRGFLATNAWIPEHSIKIILVNAETGGVSPTQFDLSNVAPFKKP